MAAFKKPVVRAEPTATALVGAPRNPARRSAWAAPGPTRAARFRALRSTVMFARTDTARLDSGLSPQFDATLAMILRILIGERHNGVIEIGMESKSLIDPSSVSSTIQKLCVSSFFFFSFLFCDITMILVACLFYRAFRYFIFSKIYANCSRAALLDKNLSPRVNQTG